MITVFSYILICKSMHQHWFDVEKLLLYMTDHQILFTTSLTYFLKYIPAIVNVKFFSRIHCHFNDSYLNQRVTRNSLKLTGFIDRENTFRLIKLIHTCNNANISLPPCVVWLYRRIIAEILQVCYWCVCDSCVFCTPPTIYLGKWFTLYDC